MGMQSLPSRHTRLAVMWSLALGMIPLSAHERENEALARHFTPEDSTTWAIQAGWDSRYHIEGRDALDGDSLLRSQIEWGCGPWAAGLWYGNSPDQNYDELQISTAYTVELGGFDAYLGYTHLRFPIEGAHDHEIHTGIVHDGCPAGVELALDAYHSLEADGFFTEASLSRGWDLSDRLTMDVALVFGMNQGYVADGHDGANHLAFTTGLSYALTDSLALKLHATWSQGIDRDRTLAGDDTLRDFLHGGIGVEWTF